MPSSESQDTLLFNIQGKPDVVIRLPHLPGTGNEGFPTVVGQWMGQALCNTYSSSQDHSNADELNCDSDSGSGIRLPPKSSINRILDVGCGAGHLTILAGMLWPDATVTASDINDEALRSTEQNWAANGLDAGRLMTVNSSALDEFIGTDHPFQLIISNPPGAPEVEGVPVDPFFHAGQDGRSVLDEVICNATMCLEEGGVLLTVGTTLNGWKETTERMDESYGENNWIALEEKRMSVPFIDHLPEGVIRQEVIDRFASLGQEEGMERLWKSKDGNWEQIKKLLFARKVFDEDDCDEVGEIPENEVMEMLRQAQPPLEVCRMNFKPEWKNCEFLDVPGVSGIQGLISSLFDHGLAVCTLDLSDDELQAARIEVDEMHDQGILKPGNHFMDSKVHKVPRQDFANVVETLSEQDISKLAPQISKITQLLKQVQDELVKAIDTMEGWAEVQCAVYPGDGGGYDCHRDDFPDGGPRASSQPGHYQGMGRKVTSIVYLNSKDWKEDWGGQLQPYSGNSAVGKPLDKITPNGGTLLIFLSGAIDHEVLPCTHRRHAITLWMH